MDIFHINIIICVYNTLLSFWWNYFYFGSLISKFIPLPLLWLALSMFICYIVLQNFTVFIDLMRLKIIQRFDLASYFRQIENIYKVTNLFFCSLFKHSGFGALYLVNVVVLQFSTAANWSFFVEVLCFCIILLFVKDMQKWISYFFLLLRYHFVFILIWLLWRK